MGGVEAKRFLSLMLIVCLLAGMMMPMQAMASVEEMNNKQGEAAVSEHWAKEVLTKWIGLGLLKGDEKHNYNPDQPITRAEFAALINRVFNLPEQQSGTNPFTDVDEHAWFLQDVIRMYAAGLIKGVDNNKFEPNKQITRQDAAVIVARAFRVKADSQTSIPFDDSSSIASYAASDVSALKVKGYLKGYENNEFKPKQNTTRSEAIQMIDNIMGTLVTGKGEYKADVKGNVIVNTYGSALKNMVVSGDLFITQGAAEGEVLLDGVTVKGTTYILGGGKNSIMIRDSNILGPLIVDKWNSQIRIVAEGTTVIQEVQMLSGGILQEGKLSGKGFVRVIVLVPSEQTNPIIVLDGEFDEIRHMAGAVSYELGSLARVLVMIFNAAAAVTGDGVIQIATINVNGVELSKWPNKVNFASDVAAAIGNELVRADNRNTTTNPGGNGNGNGGEPEPTASPEPTATPKPTATPEPTASPVQAKMIVESGVPKADIYVNGSDNEMMALAAKELQDAIKLVSGAELPVYKWNSEADVSAVLGTTRLDITRSGQYPIQLHLVNNKETPVYVNLAQSNDGPIKVILPEGVDLASREKRVVEGSIEVTNAVISGKYEMNVQASVNEIALNPLKMTIDYDPNLLANSGFELAESGGNVPNGWFLPSGTRDDKVSYSGSHAMRIDLGNSAYNFANSTQNIKLKQGTRYKLSAWVKATGTGIVNMEIHEMLSAGGSNPVTQRAEAALSNEWQFLQLEYKPTENAQYDYNSVFFFMSGTESMWVDDISLTEIPDVPGEPYEPANNLLYNAGYETGNAEGSFPDGWYSPTGAWGEEFKSGAKSMKLELQGDYAFARALQDLQLQPGKRYKLSAWVKGASAGTLNMEIHEMLENGGNNPVTSRAVAALTEEWQLVELEYAPDVNTVYKHNWVFFFMSGTESLWVDDVTLTEVAEALTSTSASASSVENADDLTSVTASIENADEVTSTENVGGSDDRISIILATPESSPEVAVLFAEDIAYLQHSDGFAVRQAGNRIYIIGTEPKGVLNGVFDFMEKNAGVIWTRSQEIGTLYDSQPTIKAIHYNYREKSPFQLRGWHLTGSGAQGQFHSDPATELMAARNKLNAKLAEFGNISLWDDHERKGLKAFNLGHDLVYWLPSEEYFAAHPEYFNTDDNGNYIPGTGETQINFYNPEVAEVIAGRVKDYLLNNPREYVGMGINDTHYWKQGNLSSSPFELPDGTLIYPDEADYKSTIFYSFLNKIAAEVKKSYPNVKINTFAYFFAEVPPRIELEDNIVIVLAPISGDDRLPINTDKVSVNNEYVQKLSGWLKKTNNIVMYNYYGSFPSATYERPIADKVQADMKYYRDLGLMGVLPENIVDASGANWGVNALQYWLMHKLFWNPDADLAALKNDFIQKAYGAAAEPMKRYYDLIAQGWNNDQQPVSYITSTKTYVRSYIIDAGIKDNAQMALNEAWSLADEKAKRRIEPIKTTFESMVFKYGELPNLSAKATKTTAGKEEIVNGLDFSQGPWAAAEPATGFYYMGTTDKAPVETKVRLLWDEENLYVGYENFDDDVSKIVASDTAPQEWWASGGDDDVETYVTGDLTGNSYYVFFTNPKAVKLEYSGPVQTSSFSAPWEAYTKTGTDRWNAIQVIPFASINVDPSVSKTLKAFFFREYHGKEAFLGWGGGSVWNWADFKTVTLEE